MIESKCPRCESDRASDQQLWWICDSAMSQGVFLQSEQCKDRQIARLQSALEAAERERDEIKEKAIEQSNDVQRNWASPCEKVGMEGMIARLREELTAATARAEAMEKKLHLLRFGVATLVERFHHWSQTDGDMGWSKGMREAGDELDELLSQPEVSDGK